MAFDSAVHNIHKFTQVIGENDANNDDTCLTSLLNSWELQYKG